jgi:hypothetical protein
VSEYIGSELEDEREAMASGKSLDQQSIMERLRKTHREITEHTTVDMDLPHYHMLDVDAVDRIGKKARRQYGKSKDQQAQLLLAASCDALIQACDGLFYRDDDGAMHQIQYNDLPVLYDQSLAEFLDLRGQDGEPLSSGRQVVQAMFGYNDTSVIDHYVRLTRWMRDTSVDVNSELLGEM